ncbi:MAG TPA: GvpL/GvpF family gas vesicle protein [Dehalococcoidia bacterium]|nr:GvpL/GvpF family gas vesicle protein [Dehalococcoidia bacterium]
MSRNQMSRGESSLLYLYCILEPDTAATGLLSDGDVPGVEPQEPLFAIEGAKLVAAVSRVQRETFSEEGLNELLTDLPRLAPYAIRHEQAIRDLFHAAPALLPMTFGSVYLSNSRIRRMLAEHATDFRMRLDRLRGRQEWEMKVFQRPAALLAAAAASAAQRPEASRPNNVTDATPGPGKAYLLQRLQERWSVEEAGRMTAAMLRSIQARLATVSSATRIENSEGASADNIDLVCRLAVLVPSSRSGDLQTLTDDLQREFEPLGLSLELSGPWPAYSFVGGDDGAN